MPGKSENQPHKVAVLAYDGLCTFEFGIAIEIFALPRPEIDLPWYACRVCSFDKGPLRATGGLSVAAPYGPRALSWADTILIPGWHDVDQPIPDSITTALSKAHARGARLVSICSGVFVLAATSLLNGISAATHWRYSSRLQDAYPSILVEPDMLYIDHGNILTSAGSAAGIDLCLHIVKRDYGTAAANIVARRLVLPTHRDGGQTQYIPTPVTEGPQSLGSLLDWLRAQLHIPHTVASMADQAGQSQRTFIRRFRQSTGASPHAWLTRERIQHARGLLETTRLNSDQIAERCGFATAETFRHHFRRLIGVPPMRYRASFQAD